MDMFVVNIFSTYSQVLQVHVRKHMMSIAVKNTLFFVCFIDISGYSAATHVQNISLKCIVRSNAAFSTSSKHSSFSVRSPTLATRNSVSRRRRRRHTCWKPLLCRPDNCETRRTNIIATASGGRFKTFLKKCSSERVEWVRRTYTNVYSFIIGSIKYTVFRQWVVTQNAFSRFPLFRTFFRETFLMRFCGRA